MGSLNFVCPMCCGETFNSSQSLKYHLLSMTDNLYCPGCSQRLDSVMALIQHLDKCGQDSEESEESTTSKQNFETESSIMEVVSTKEGDMQQNESSSELHNNFLTSVPEGIMIVGGPRTITVDENGPVVNVKISVSVNKDNEKNIKNILPTSSHTLSDEDSHLIGVDNPDDSQESNDVQLLEIKEELSEQETDAVYSCSSCGMSFTSVFEHIHQYHEGQEVVLEMADQQFEDFQANSGFTCESESVTATNSRLVKNTLHAEECKDSDGRLYTRKVVQIDKFWDHVNSGSVQTHKSPMIEKFFSNVEGVKVRDKNSASAQVRTYKCNRCMEQFTKFVEFRVHPCTNGSNQCDQCDQSFATVKALQLHYKIHEQEVDSAQKAFICPDCGTEFLTHKSLRLHSRMHAPVRARHVEAPEGTEETTFTCKECGKTFSESYRLAHMALHTGDSVTCSICNRKFDSSESLAMHAAVHTEVISQTHSPIPPVNETLMSNNVTSSTVNTINITENNSNTSSTHPSNTVTNTSTVNTAVDSVDGQSQKPYQCQHCGRRFARPHEKVKHERIHTGEKPHACEVCGKTFRVSYCLTLHMRTHTGVRPYACNYCGKRFKASSVYNHHLLTHGDERAYTCPYCPKTFKTRVQLAGHKNSHTKPFRCTECSRPFASLYAARAHIQTHKKVNNLKHSCDICGASYGRAFALKDHRKQHEEDMSVTPELAREEEIQEAFIVREEEVEDEKLVIPSPLPSKSSTHEDSN